MRKLFLFLIFILFSVTLYVFARNDSFLYHQPVVRISKVKNSRTEKTVDEYGNHDQTTSQMLKGTILNTKDKGQTVRLTNTFTKSHGEDQRLRKGQDIFIKPTFNTQGKIKSVYFLNFKRDTYLISLSWLILVALFAMMRLKGLKTILSVIVNFVFFILLVQLDIKWNITNFFIIYIVGALVFTALSLLIVIGCNRQSKVIFTSIIIGTTIALLITLAGMKITNDNGMHYEALDFATQQPKQLFLSSALIGLLGTVMDAATDIVSTIFELNRKHPELSFKKLFTSGSQVGISIMGPLVNVLLLIFFSDTIALAILYLKTGNTYNYTFQWTMSLGLAQSLISGIGITLVIPTASFIAAWRLGEKKG